MKTSASSETPTEPFSLESGEGLLPRHPGEKSVPCHSSEESSLRNSSEASSLRHSRESSPPAGARNPSSPAAKTRECVVVLDFGSQYSPLIVRRIRECGVYAELMPYDADEEIRARPQSAGLGALRGACERLRAGRAAPATLRLAGQAAGLGYLLRHAAHGPGVGRQCGPRRQARIRARHDPCAAVSRCLCRHRARPGRVDESRRPHHGTAVGLSRCWPRRPIRLLPPWATRRA